MSGPNRRAPMSSVPCPTVRTPFGNSAVGSLFASVATAEPVSSRLPV
jgi:hypothetical protein